MQPWQRPYLTGKCFDFVLALAEAVDNPVFVAIGSAKYPDHVGLRVGDELYADIRGVLGRAEFLAHHADSEDAIDVVERDDVAFQCGLSGFEPPYKGNRDIAAARGAVRLAFPDGLRAAVDAAIAAQQSCRP